MSLVYKVRAQKFSEEEDLYMIIIFALSYPRNLGFKISFKARHSLHLMIGVRTEFPQAVESPGEFEMPYGKKSPH